MEIQSHVSFLNPDKFDDAMQLPRDVADRLRLGIWRLCKDGRTLEMRDVPAQRLGSRPTVRFTVDELSWRWAGGDGAEAEKFFHDLSSNKQAGLSLSCAPAR